MKTKTITNEIDELRAMTVPALVERYREVYGKEPRIRHREWLWKRVAWKVQEQRLGGLSKVAQKRLEELIAEIDLPIDERKRTVSGRLKAPRKPTDPAVGTCITRHWRGREIRVQVLDTGFECDGVVYGSLSAVARAVTGSRWNGKLFFGLTGRKRKAAQ